jgi:hypothetical protein
VTGAAAAPAIAAARALTLANAVVRSGMASFAAGTPALTHG